MKIISVNISLPKKVIYGKEIVTTGIFKLPIVGPIKLEKLNLEGDKQADLTVHGGINKAVYVYPKEYYDYWQNKLLRTDLSWGMFGENFTTEGLFEDDVNVGDIFNIGTCKIMATQPRIPCYKLGIKFGNMGVIKEFLNSGKPGIYFSVIREGIVEAGNTIHLLKKDENNITIKDILLLFQKKIKDIKLMNRALKVDALPDSWKEYFSSQLSKIDK
ncbi:MAG TPA: MOSC domain-containing protein [Candidatus Nitrosocosmicus sp.]